MDVNDATDGTDATTDEASDRSFDTRSFIINIKLVGVCFFRYIVSCDLLLFIRFIRSRRLEFVLLRGIKLTKKADDRVAEAVVDNY